MTCRQVRAKRELIRLVRNFDGSVEIDTSGKKAGRGAYLCPSPECWEVGLKEKRLEHTLHATITQNNLEKLTLDERSLTGVN